MYGCRDVGMEGCRDVRYLQVFLPGGVRNLEEQWSRAQWWHQVAMLEEGKRKEVEGGDVGNMTMFIPGEGLGT